MMPLLPTIEEEGKLPWLRLMWRYRLQFQAMASASVIFIAGGMKLAWSIFESPSGKFTSNASTHQLTISWFLGVMIGAVIAATFVQRTTKNVAHCTSGALILFGGILFITLPHYFVALAVGCVCEGCAYGLTQVQAIVTGGEVAHKTIRGLIMSSERIFLWMGICLQLMYTRLWYAFEIPSIAIPSPATATSSATMPTTTVTAASGYVLGIDQLHGIIIGCLGLLAIVLTLVYRLESPLLLKLQQRDMAATYVVKRLQGAHYPSTEVQQMREECKQLLAYDAAGHNAWQVFKEQNAWPLLKIIVVRCFAALALSLPFNRAFLTVSWNGFACDMNCIYWLALCGLVGSIVGAFLIDEHGRRRLAVVSLLLAAIFIFTVGGVFEYMRSTDKMYGKFVMEMAAYNMMMYQFVTSAGIALASTVYASEAFTVCNKSKCIAVVIICEHMLQTCLALAVFYALNFNSSIFFFTMGTLGLLLGLLVFLFMPETKYLPLHECLVKFKKFP